MPIPPPFFDKLFSDKDQQKFTEPWYRWFQQVSGVVSEFGSSLLALTDRKHSYLQNILGTGDRHITANENAEITALDGLGTGIVVKTGNATYSPRANIDSNLNLATLNSIALDTTPTAIAGTPGEFKWNSVDGTFDFHLYNNTTLQAGQELHFYGKASGTIANGDLCQFAGVQGDHILIKKVVPAEIIAYPHYLVGVATQNIASGDFGYVTWFGKVNGVYTKTPNNQDSADWLAGDVLCFDNTTGQMTKTSPSAPEIKIIVAAVVKEQSGAAENGIILVRPSFGSKLVDLDDVDGAVPTDGDLIVYDGANSYFNPSKTLPKAITISDTTDSTTKDTGCLILEGGLGVEKNIVAGAMVQGATGKFGNVAGGNYSEFESDGTLEFLGDATVWEDLRVEPVVRAGAGTAGVPAFEKWYDDAGGTSKGVFLYSFTDEVAAQEKEVHFTIQMPHAWAGTAIYPHVHWVGNTADTDATPYWGLEYAWADIGATFGDTSTIYATGNGPGTPDADVTPGKHYISSFSTLTPSTSQDGISSVLIGRLYRNSSSASDTYNVAGNKCGLLYIDFHYEVNTCGSRTEFIK